VGIDSPGRVTSIERDSSCASALEQCLDFGLNALTRAENSEMSKATNLQEAPNSWAVDRGYAMQVGKAELKR
jgi:hypothetical protein